MRRAAITLAEAQSFDRVAGAYDRLGDLNPNELIDSWLEGLLPAAGGRALDIGCGTGRHATLLAGRFEQVDAIDLSGPMIDLATTRRSRPNITYWQADLHDVADTGRYDFVLSLLTLHHVPDLHAALSHIKTLLAPGGRAVLMDIYPPESALRPQQALRRMLHQLVPLRPGRDWLDHRVTDRFFSRDVQRPTR